jgi:hypothetical protein
MTKEMTKRQRTSSPPARSHRLKSSTLHAPRRATTTAKDRTIKTRASSSTSSKGSSKASSGTSSGTASSRTSRSSRSTIEAPTTIAQEAIRTICGSCKGLRSARLKRLESVRLQDVSVENALVYVCDECGRVSGTPQVTSGRIFAAIEDQRSSASPVELRVPREAEDLAYAIHAALGLRPSGDVFALAIGLGLRHVGMEEKAQSSWRMLDELEKSVRARPVLSEELSLRIDGLKDAWGAPDRSTVARWLLVAGARALGVI